MRILDGDQLPLRVVTHFGSSGFAVSPVAQGSSIQLAVLHLDANGHIGRHTATAAQLLFLLRGEATVSGAVGGPLALLPGQAVSWEAGESHETRSLTGMTGLVIEGDLKLTRGADS